MELQEFIIQALKEDIGNGDHTTLACIPENVNGKAVLKVKDNGIIAGIELAQIIAAKYDSELKFELLLNDGNKVKAGDVAFIISGRKQSLLTTERLILNCMQRMSGIATITNKFVKEVEGTGAKILDTRKTTPLNRVIEKRAVRIGGGMNHRFGLFDMILIKDNHIDMCGGVKEAIRNTKQYLSKNNLSLRIEIEARNLEEIKMIVDEGGIDRILIDNFNPDTMFKAVELIHNRFETEASGGIVLENVRSYAETGVNYISVGALTHSYKSLDLSLKAFE